MINHQGLSPLILLLRKTVRITESQEGTKCSKSSEESKKVQVPDMPYLLVRCSLIPTGRRIDSTLQTTLALKKTLIFTICVPPTVSFISSGFLILGNLSATLVGFRVSRLPLSLKPKSDSKPVGTTADLLRLCAQALTGFISDAPSMGGSDSVHSLHLCRALHGPSNLPCKKSLRKNVRAPVGISVKI